MLCSESIIPTSLNFAIVFHNKHSITYKMRLIHMALALFVGVALASPVVVDKRVVSCVR